VDVWVIFKALQNFIFRRSSHPRRAAETVCGCFRRDTISAPRGGARRSKFYCLSLHAEQDTKKMQPRTACGTGFRLKKARAVSSLTPADFADEKPQASTTRCVCGRQISSAPPAPWWDALLRNGAEAIFPVGEIPEALAIQAPSL